MVGRTRHEHFGPLVVVGVRAAGDLRDRLLAIPANVGLILPVEVRIVQRHHVAAASPALVADTEEVEPERLLTPVPLAQVRHGRPSVERHVLHPFGHLGDRAASDVAVDIRLGVELLQQLEVLVRAERIGLYDSAPMRVHHGLAVLTDPAAPVVFVREAPARPSDDRNLDRAKRGDDILTDAVLVRDAGIGSHPQPLVDAAAQMLGELPVDPSVDVVARFSRRR